MKCLLSIIIIIFLNTCFAQDTLYLEVPNLGSEKYVLYENGTFVYSSRLCGSTFVSYGNYKKNLLGYHFDYDTTRCPIPSIIELKKVNDQDSMKLFFYDNIDSTLQTYYGKIIIGEKSYNYEYGSDSVIISKLNIQPNSLIITQFNQELSFTFDPASSVLKIYLETAGFGYKCGINDLRKLRKTPQGFLHKFVVYDENQEKSWKKKKKRIVRSYYQLLN